MRASDKLRVQRSTHNWHCGPVVAAQLRAAIKLSLREKALLNSWDRLFLLLALCGRHGGMARGGDFGVMRGVLWFTHVCLRDEFTICLGVSLTARILIARQTKHKLFNALRKS